MVSQQRHLQATTAHRRDAKKSKNRVSVGRPRRCPITSVRLAPSQSPISAPRVHEPAETDRFEPL
ncbi:MAG: hypothetical protein MI923_09770 [Phycisphaerales bacterium]|nr:hypothetical protein [Phycisphaerales bacterium]